MRQANPFLARRLVILRARLALAQGDAPAAIELARRAYPMPLPADDHGEGQAEIARVHQRALIQASRAKTAPPNETRLAPTSFAYPVQLLQEAEWTDFEGHDPADLYRRALEMAEKRGEPADIASVAESFGPWLLKHGDIEQAGAVIGRVAPWAAYDYDCAVLQVAIYHALKQEGPWRTALEHAKSLAGDRKIPPELLDLAVE
jgi:hypothetical protein